MRSIVAVLLPALVGMAVAGCGGDGDKTAGKRTTTGEDGKTTAGKATYKSDKYGVSFDYPSDWKSRGVEKPGVVSFGDDDKISTCSFAFSRSGGPSSKDRQSLYQYAQRQAKKTSRKAESYDLEAIQTEHGANIEGVGIIRTATLDGEARGAHIAFFFVEGNRFLIDCTTEPGRFEKVDEHVFRPLIKSMRIDPPDDLESHVKKPPARKKAAASKRWKSRIRADVKRIGDVRYASVRGTNPVDIRIGVRDPDQITDTMTMVVGASLGVRPSLDVKVTAADPDGESVGWAEWDAGKNEGYMHPPSGPSAPIEFGD